MALGLSGVLKRCLRRDAPGRQLVKKVVPDAADYVVLKLKHSAFYATPLETLLSYMKAKAVILVGLTTDACIVISASEIYVRDLELFIPSDCVRALRQRDHQNALELMKKSFGENTTVSTRLDLRKLLRDRQG
jgi:nicotinamidase-related amidase